MITGSPKHGFSYIEIERLLVDAANKASVLHRIRQLVIEVDNQICEYHNVLPRGWVREWIPLRSRILNIADFIGHLHEGILEKKRNG